MRIEFDEAPPLNLGVELDAIIKANSLSVPVSAGREAFGRQQHDDGSAWAADYRRMPEGSVLDRWDEGKVPPLKEIAQAMASADPAKKFVGIAKSSQIGASETMTNDQLWHMDEKPTSMLAYMPTEAMLKTYQQTRLNRALRLPPFTGRGLHKVRNEYYIDNASLLTFSAGTANSMSAVTAQRVYADELARFKEDIGGEGDWVSLASQRAATFGERAKIIVASTPVDQTSGEGTFWSFHQRGDCRVWKVKCPGCGGAWEHDVEQLRKRTDEKGNEEYVMVCPLPVGEPDEGGEMAKCGYAIRDGDARDRVVATGFWEATKEPEYGYTSYHVNGLYAPSEWRPYSAFFNEFKACRDGKASRKAFYNTWLGKFYQDSDARKPPPGVVEQRMTAHYQLRKGIVPDFAGILLLAIDVQQDRLVYSVAAVGPRMEMMFIEVGEPECKIADTEKVVGIIRDLFERRFVRQDGRVMQIYAGVIDEGYAAAEVHAVTDQFPQGIYHSNTAVIPKGCLQPVRGGDAAVVSSPILSVPGGPTNYGKPNNNKFVRIGSPMIKFRIYRSLEADPLDDIGWRLHASIDLPPEFYEQIVAEDIVSSWHKLTMKKTLMFRKPHESKKNDYLDCATYSQALCHLLRAETWSEEEWKSWRDSESVTQEEGARLTEASAEERKRADEEEAAYQAELKAMQADPDY